MTGRRLSTDDISFAAEGMAGTAAAAALRRVRSLADQAPSGRMFAAIATLTDMSRRAGASLAAGHDAMLSGEPGKATQMFARSIVQMDHLAAAAEREPEVAEVLPGYLLKRR